jgi:hypothetical protein
MATLSRALLLGPGVIIITAVLLGFDRHEW